jgi:hypothetical protein
VRAAAACARLRLAGPAGAQAHIGGPSAYSTAAAAHTSAAAEKHARWQRGPVQSVHSAVPYLLRGPALRRGGDPA